MRTTLKLVSPLIISVAIVSLLFAGYQVRTQKRILRNELAHRAETLAESLQSSVESLSERGAERNAQRLVERFGQKEHLRGVAIYDEVGSALAITPAIGGAFKKQPHAVSRALELSTGYGEFWGAGDTAVYVYGEPVNDGKAFRALAVVYDASYIGAQTSRTLRDSLLNALVQTLLIASLAIVLVRWTLTDPIRRTARWLRTLRMGQSPAGPRLPQGEVFDQLHKEATHLANDLTVARAQAETEARLRDTQSTIWTPERLRVSLRNKLQDRPLFVVSNREPYMHVFGERDKSIQVIIPASGVVTALEPVLVACDGTWIANGSGSADREVVDARDRLRVPPERPSYTLRRVWLTDEEDRGYYEGFSNEGLWPLCHIAHTRPIFRPED